MFSAPINYSPDTTDLEYFSTHSSLVRDLEIKDNQGVIVIAELRNRIYVMLESQSQSHRLMQTRFIDLDCMNFLEFKNTTQNSWGFSWQVKHWNTKDYSRSNPSLIYNQFIEREIPKELLCFDLDLLPYHPVQKNQLERFKEEFDEITGGIEPGTPHNPMEDITEALNQCDIQLRDCNYSCTIS